MKDSKRPSNLESIKKVLPNAEIFTAINGNSIKIDDSRVVNPFISNHIKYNKRFEKILTMSKGALGCYMSHRELWLKCIKLNESIIVCEEDIIFYGKEDVTNKIINNIPKDADFAAIYFIPILAELKKLPKSKEKDWSKVNKYFAGTQCYYITPKGCELLLKHSMPISGPVDVYIGYIFENNPSYNAYASKYNPYYLTEFIKDNISSSISQRYDIKWVLPNGNLFYIFFIILFILLCITVVLLSYKLYKISYHKSN
jgi:GR25 family glycosyltransferase involved in LPS biosynthesis